MKKNYIVTLVILFFCTCINAQVTNEKTPTADSTPIFIVIEQDYRIAELVSKKIYIPAAEKEEKTVVNNPNSKIKVDKFGRVNLPGYRLQLMNSTDRPAIYNMKGKVYQIYPSQRMYVVAQAPFYKLRFGNFKTKEEAERYKKALSPMFPGGINIVPDIIEGFIPPKPKITTTATATDEKKKTSNKVTNKTTTKPKNTKPVAKTTTKPLATKSNTKKTAPTKKTTTKPVSKPKTNKTN